MMFQTFTLETSVWDAFFRNVLQENIPVPAGFGSRVLCLPFFARAGNHHRVMREFPLEEAAQQEGSLAIFPHQQLGYFLPLALAHLWWMATDIRVTFWSLMNRQGLVHIDTDLDSVEAIADVTQIDLTDYDFILTGSTHPGDDINSAHKIAFTAHLWDVATKELLYVKDSREDGHDLRQNMSHLGTEVTNILFDNGQSSLISDDLSHFSFWLGDNDLWALGSITHMLAVELAHQMGATHNLVRYDQWPHVLRELANMAGHHHRPEFYKAYFMYLMCRHLNPGIGEEEKMVLDTMVSHTPENIREDLYPYISALTKRLG